MGDLVSQAAGSPDAARHMLAQALANKFEPGEGNPRDALDILARWSVPLKEQEPSGIVRDDKAELGFRFDGRATAKLADSLRPMGIKINPTMSAPQVGAWLAAMIAALSDLPPRVAIKAAQDAIHVPMRFLNEVESAVRDKAEGAASRYNLAQLRLEKHLREIERATSPAPALPPPAPMTQADINAMAKTTIGRDLLRIGLQNGWITEEQHAEATGGGDAKTSV